MFKKMAIVVILLFVCANLFGIDGVYVYDANSKITDPGKLYTAKSRWIVMDSSTAADAEPTDLAADKRTYQAVKALIAAADNASTGNGEIAIFDVPNTWNDLRVRCIGVTNDSLIVYQVYLGNLGPGNKHKDSTAADCELAYGGQLTFTIGQQSSVTSTYEFADTLAATNGDVTAEWTFTSPLSDRIAEGKIDLQGADVIVLVPTTVACDCKLLGNGY